MNLWRIRTVSIPLFLAALFIVAAAAQEADEFRVETDVFVEDSKEPVSETLTLFAGDVIYDFILAEPEEITILDVRRSRILLLDKARRVKTTLTTDELQQFTAALKLLGEAEQKGIFAPEFVPQFDEKKGELVLKGRRLTYQALGIEPKQSGAARRYREFADWIARLNAARLRSLPPFARIELNRSLSDRGLVPTKVSRTVVTQQPLVDKKTTAHSRHSYVWRFSNSDRKRIESAGTYQASFKAVSLSEYWRTGRVAARKK